MRRLAYVGRVTSRSGAVVTHIARGSTAGAALTNLRRSLVGDWCRIEVGLGEGEAFRCLEEKSR